MAYTPELSQQNSAALRRIAWALDLPMTETMDRVFFDIVNRVDKNKVCFSCKDKSVCGTCAFGNGNI